MIAMIAVAQVQAAPADAADVTVVGARLRKIRVSADTNKKGLITRCQVTVSSGDLAFDAQACEATRACAAEGKQASDAMTECVDRRMIAFVEAQRGQKSRSGNDAQN
jgi:TonB family protein